MKFSNTSSFKNLLFILTIILSASFAYSFMVSDSFKTMDDNVSVVNNEDIRSFSNIGKIFSSSYFGGKSYYRPFVYLSYMIEYHLCGLTPCVYYMVNILIHILTALTVFGLMKLFFDDEYSPFFIALLFAIHPIHWEAVSNIPGRAILLCGLFVLNAFRFFILSRRTKKNAFYVLSFISFILALLSKESAAMFPIVLMFYVFLVENNAKQRVFSRFASVMPFFGIILLYIFLRKALGITQLFYWPSFGGRILGFISALRGFLTFIRLFIFPMGLHFDRSRILFVSFTNYEVWFTLAVYFISIVSLIVFRKKIASLVCFFIFWFFIELFPVSQLISSIGVSGGYISIAEHFLYVASVSIFAVIVILGKRIFIFAVNTLKMSYQFSRIIIFILFAGLFYMTVQQNIVASSEALMFEKTMRFAPHNLRIHNSLAMAKAVKGSFKEAEGHFREILKMDPLNTMARIGLGKSLCDQDKYWEGIKEYEKVQDAGGLKELLDQNLHIAYNILITKYKERIISDSRNADLHYSLGIMYTKISEIEESIEQYKSAVEINPYHKNALFNLASSLEGTGRKEEAVPYYKRMLQIEGDRSEEGIIAAGRLAKIYKELGNIEHWQFYLKMEEDLRNNN